MRTSDGRAEVENNMKNQKLFYIWFVIRVVRCCVFVPSSGAISPPSHSPQHVSTCMQSRHWWRWPSKPMLCGFVPVSDWKVLVFTHKVMPIHFSISPPTRRPPHNIYDSRSKREGRNNVCNNTIHFSLAISLYEFEQNTLFMIYTIEQTKSFQPRSSFGPAACFRIATDESK